MTKKDLEDIIQTAKAAGANVKVVQVGSAENEPVERPKIPLFKLEVGIKKEGDELKVMPTDDWCFLGSIFLEMAPIDIDIEKGEVVALVGASGAGKSTVLNILGGMDTNDEGRVIIDGKDISEYTAKELTTYRREDVGFVFQFYNLVSNLTARENVELASEIVPNAKDATQTLVEVGLGDRLDNFPSQLSGGEQQRVAIARAVAKNPKILLCDEPTGALDYQTGKQILTLLQEMARKQGTTVIIVTHNASLAPIADRVIRMHDAKIKSVELNPNPQKIEDLEY